MSYILDTESKINMPKKAQHPAVEEFFSNYTYGTKWSLCFDSSDNCITIGEYTKTELEGAEYVLNITKSGIYIAGCDYTALMHGFMTFLEKIKYNEKDESFYLEECLIRENIEIKFRSTHFCIFPEAKLDFLRKCIRSCAIVKNTHIVLEFWGMFKFDCLKELGWPFAYSKEQIKEVVDEANALGIEVIPMFNHLGHASSCRGINGKHVVLDQNPRYEYLFESYGWVWDIKREDVKQLHRNIRKELIEVCGEGKYFHLGCDEAYSYGHNTQKAEELACYLNEVSKELKQMGRQGILWHDMMLSNDSFKGYIANASQEVSDILTEKLDKDFIIAVWQYSFVGETWKSVQPFIDRGFKVLCCPWDKFDNIVDAVKTVKEKNTLGIMHTTWHTLYRGFSKMVFAGQVACDLSIVSDVDRYDFYAHRVARKAMPSHGNYGNSGWSEIMVGPGL
ncbi:MAG: family 20 glycosylhydrolase [Clostridia bacterium]|nr:family 20 glycosylhydrolase [Clostridia bacterium]